jgi:hypothetical protein
MHTCTTTSTDNDTSTAVNVPNAGSNASNVNALAASNVIVAEPDSLAVAAEPTPDGANAATTTTDAAATTRRRIRLPLGSAMWRITHSPLLPLCSGGGRIAVQF